MAANNVADNMAANNLQLNTNAKKNASVNSNAVKALAAQSSGSANNLLKEAEQAKNMNNASKNQIKKWQ